MERISQSFIKSMREYLSGIECGNIIREQFVNGRYFDSDEPGAMELGTYFEFLLSGSVPKSGKVPQPVYMASALKKNGGKPDGLGVDDMYADYRLAHVNAKRVRDYLDRMGIKIVLVGKKLTNGRFEGVIDLIVEVVEARSFPNGIVWNVEDKFVIDLKYSGLLGKSSNYEKHGWSWSPISKQYHGTQAIHYGIISKLPFYFLVTSSTNDEDCELFFVPVTDDMIVKHVSEANHLHEKFEYESKVGFVPHPSLKKCLGCPLKDECSDKHTFPHPKIVNLNGE